MWRENSTSRANTLRGQHLCFFTTASQIHTLTPVPALQRGLLRLAKITWSSAWLHSR